MGTSHSGESEGWPVPKLKGPAPENQKADYRKVRGTRGLSDDGLPGCSSDLGEEKGTQKGIQVTAANRLGESEAEKYRWQTTGRFTKN